MCRLGKKIGWAVALMMALGIAALGCGGAAAAGSGGGQPEAGATYDAAPAPDAGSPRDGASERPGAAHANKVVFVVAMENAEENLYSDSAGFPYLTGLLDRAARTTAFMDLLPGTPSEPHYILMEAGTNVFDDHTFTDDSNPSAANSTASTAHLVTQLAAAGISWTSYQEDMSADTGTCPIAGVGEYRPRHNPFVFFQDLVGMPPSKTAPVCAAHHKPLSALATDLAGGAVATYNFITPNLCHDAHGHADCPAGDTADGWVKGAFPALLSYVAAHDGVLFVAWDEAQSGVLLPFLALGPHVKPGYVGSTTYDHRSLLVSVEEILGVPPLPSAAGATDLADLFVTGEFP